jgi:hypothetical protein
MISSMLPVSQASKIGASSGTTWIGLKVYFQLPLDISLWNDTALKRSQSAGIILYSVVVLSSLLISPDSEGICRHPVEVIVH